MKKNLDFEELDWFHTLRENVLCIVWIPLDIMRHLWHLWGAILSTLAVLLASVISFVSGTEYPQYVELFWADKEDPMYQDMPDWYVWFVCDVNNYITTFHAWMVDCISYDMDDDGDDDDFDGGDISPVDEHEELEQPA